MSQVPKACSAKAICCAISARAWCVRRDYSSHKLISWLHSARASLHASTKSWRATQNKTANSYTGEISIYNEGDELVLCEARFPLAAGTTADDVEAALEECPEFRRASATSCGFTRSPERHTEGEIT